MRGSRTAVLLIVLAGLCAALVGVLANLVVGDELRGWLKARGWYSLEALGLLLVVLVVLGIATALWQHRLTGGQEGRRPAPTRAQLKRNRQRMIQRVRCDWIQGVLEQSLYRVARMDLNLEERPDAVDRPWDILLQVPDQAPRMLPPGMLMSQIFDEHGGALLILGAPGSGKTTLLLELARDLLDRAEQEESYPIPVVFHLSSWAVVIQPLTREQVAEYFSRAGTRLDGLRAAVQNDEELWTLLDNPLMLSVAMLAYQGAPEKTAEPAGTQEDRRTRLFAKYVETMFRRRGRPTRYTQEQSTRWLAWLASSMTRLGQSVSHVEDLAPVVRSGLPLPQVCWLRRSWRCRVAGSPGSPRSLPS